jgi:hypothetical protein
MFIAGKGLAASTANEPKDQRYHNHNNDYCGPETSLKNSAHYFAGTHGHSQCNKTKP